MPALDNPIPASSRGTENTSPMPRGPITFQEYFQKLAKILDGCSPLVQKVDNIVPSTSMKAPPERRLGSGAKTWEPAIKKKRHTTEEIIRILRRSRRRCEVGSR